MDVASSLQFGWFTLHLMGITSALLLRIYSGRSVEPLLRIVFVGQLAIVAAAALAGRQLCWRLGELSAATLAAMVVAVVLEAGPRRVGEKSDRRLA